MSVLAEQLTTLKDAGVDDVEIEAYKKNQVQTLHEAGVETEEIAKELGYKEVNLSPIRSFWQSVIDIGKSDHEKTYSELESLAAQNDTRPFIQKRKEELVGEIFEPKKYWTRGWDAGIYDLHQSYVHGEKIPELYLSNMPNDTGFLERNIMNVSRLVKDFPVYAGTTVPLLLATRGKAADLSIAVGAFAAGSLRETYLKGLMNDEVNGFNEFFKIWTDEGIKAGATEAAQIYAALKLGGAFKGPFKKTIANAIGFEATGALIHQEMPSKEQMQDSLFLFGLFNYGGYATAKSKQVLMKNERTLPELAEDIVIHKTMADDMPSKTNTTPRQYGEEKTVTYKPEKFKEGIKFETKEEQAIFDKTKYSEREPITTTEGVKESAVRKKDASVTNLVDRLHPIKRIIEQVQQTTNMRGALNVYERFRALLGMENRAGTFIETATQNARLKDNGKSLKEILQPLLSDKIAIPLLPKKVPFSLKARDQQNRQTYAEFNNYAISKRVVEKQKTDIETGITLEVAEKVANNPKLIKRYEKVRQELIAYNRRLLEYARDRGLITKEAFDAMVAANKEYIGFARVMDVTSKGEIISGGKVNSLKTMKGSKKDIIDPIETTYSNTFAIIKKAERNATISEFITLIEKGQEKGLFKDIQKKVTTKKIEINVKELQDLGIDTSKLSKKTIENLQIFRRDMDKIGDDSVGVVRNGKFEVWEVGKDLAEAMKEFDPRSAKNLTTYLASKPASWLRAGATLAFDFVGANFLRDTVQAAIYSKYGFFPIVSSIRGLFDIIAGRTGLIKNSEKLYNDWVKSGGMQSTMLSVDRAIFDKPAFDILNKGQIRNKAESPIEILRVISETFENATRISEYRRAYNASRKKGLSHKQAVERGGFESRDITLDFGKMGVKIKTLNQISAFYNARIQGFAKLYDAAKERPTRALLTITGGIMTPTAILWFLNKDDKDIQAQPAWVKRHYWLVATGEGEDKIIHKIPKPFDVGVVFASLVESFLDHNYSKDETTRKQLDGWFTDYLMTTAKGFIPTPQVGLPIFEAWTNRSWFRNQPLVPEYIAKTLPNDMQYTNYTSESAKIIASTLYKIIGTDTKFSNPVFIDNFIRAWTGTLGRYALQASDQALIESGVIDDPIRPDQPLSSLPVFRAFVAKNPDLSSQWITTFYEEYNKIEKEINRASSLEKEGKPLESEAILKKIPKTSWQLKIYADSMKEYGAMIRNIYNNKKYTSEEKRELIDEFARLMINTAKRSLDIMNIKVEPQEQR